MSPFLLEAQVHSLPPGHPIDPTTTVQVVSSERLNEHFSYHFGRALLMVVAVAAGLLLLGLLL